MRGMASTWPPGRTALLVTAAAAAGKGTRSRAGDGSIARTSLLPQLCRTTVGVRISISSTDRPALPPPLPPKECRAAGLTEAAACCCGRCCTWPRVPRPPLLPLPAECLSRPPKLPPMAMAALPGEREVREPTAAAAAAAKARILLEELRRAAAMGAAAPTLPAKAAAKPPPPPPGEDATPLPLFPLLVLRLLLLVRTGAYLGADIPAAGLDDK